jgi:hypothetical protein
MSEQDQEENKRRALLRKALAFEEMRHEPSILWHYTSIKACLGILNTKFLQLTNAQYLNDSQELVHFFDHVLNNRAIYFSTGGADDSDKYWLPNSGFDGFVPVKDSNFEAMFSAQLQTSQTTILGSNVCVGSFSEESDLLSQWRAYSRNDTGVAIGFSVGVLVEIAEKYNFVVRSCSYLGKGTGKNYWVTRFIQEAQSHLRDPDAFQASCIQTAARFKDSSFSEEKEWRIITGPINSSESRIKFRATPNNLVPYYEMDYSDFYQKLITEIRVGPGPHQDIACKSIEAIGSKYGYRFLVSRSSVPFRSNI